MPGKQEELGDNVFIGKKRSNLAWTDDFELRRSQEVKLGLTGRVRGSVKNAKKQRVFLSLCGWGQLFKISNIFHHIMHEIIDIWHEDFDGDI